MTGPSVIADLDWLAGARAWTVVDWVDGDSDGNWCRRWERGTMTVVVTVWLDPARPRATGRVVDVRDEHGAVVGGRSLVRRLLRRDSCPFCSRSAQTPPKQ